MLTLRFTQRNSRGIFKKINLTLHRSIVCKQRCPQTQVEGSVRSTYIWMELLHNMPWVHYSSKYFVNTVWVRLIPQIILQCGISLFFSVMQLLFMQMVSLQWVHNEADRIRSIEKRFKSLCLQYSRDRHENSLRIWAQTDGFFGLLRKHVVTIHVDPKIMVNI